jgi:AcrR family transcriptional regulator
MQPMTKAAKRRTGPGRPEGQSGLREEILKAALRVFADLGYSGSSLRQVAEAAGVTTALINYYFGSKRQLYEEVYMGKALGISQARLDKLRELEQAGKATDAEALVRAFLDPLIEMRRSREGATFLRMQWGLHTESKELSNALRGKAYDASTHAYAAALQKALPHLSKAAVYSRLLLIVGATVFLFSGTHRLDELVPGMDAESETDVIVNELVSVLTRGIATA